MRQMLSEKKMRRLRKLTGLPIRQVWVRGGTDHRRDLYLESGEVICMLKDGTMAPSILNRHREIRGQQQAAES